MAETIQWLGVDVKRKRVSVIRPPSKTFQRKSTSFKRARVSEWEQLVFSAAHPMTQGTTGANILSSSKCSWVLMFSQLSEFVKLEYFYKKPLRVPRFPASWTTKRSRGRIVFSAKKNWQPWWLLSAGFSFLFQKWAPLPHVVVHVIASSCPIFTFETLVSFLLGVCLKLQFCSVILISPQGNKRFVTKSDEPRQEMLIEKHTFMCRWR